MGRRIVAIGSGRLARRACTLALAAASILGPIRPAQAIRHGCTVATTATGLRCGRKPAALADAGGKRPQPSRPGGKAPKIESGGISPAVDNTIPLLRPGTFRLDLAGFAAVHPLFGIGPQHDSRTDLFETITLGYGVNPRLTVFAGALEVNSDHDGGPYQANYVDPKVGLIYRVATAPELHGNTLDFAGDVTINEPFGGLNPTGTPLSDLGPVGRARFLLTRDLGHGLTLEGIGGVQMAQVTTIGPFGGLGGHTTTDVDAILGLAGQYRLGFISDRLYANGELDYLRPLSDDSYQVFVDSPFKTTESYAATLGASYVLKPGTIVVRATDTVALVLANPYEGFVPRGSSRQLYNTVGITLSFCNLEPGHWLAGRFP